MNWIERWLELRSWKRNESQLASINQLTKWINTWTLLINTQFTNMHLINVLFISYRFIYRLILSIAYYNCKQFLFRISSENRTGGIFSTDNPWLRLKQTGAIQAWYLKSASIINRGSLSTWRSRKSGALIAWIFPGTSGELNALRASHAWSG